MATGADAASIVITVRGHNTELDLERLRDAQSDQSVA
jgi:hypothetical protein